MRICPEHDIEFATGTCWMCGSAGEEKPWDGVEPWTTGSHQWSAPRDSAFSEPTRTPGKQTIRFA